MLRNMDDMAKSIKNHMKKLDKTLMTVLCSTKSSPIQN